MESQNELSEIKEILDRLEEEEVRDDYPEEVETKPNPDEAEEPNADDSLLEDEQEEVEKEEVDYKAQVGRLQRELTRAKKKLERTPKTTKRSSRESYVTRDELVLRDLKQDFEPAVADEILLYAKGLGIDPIEASKRPHWKAQNEVTRRQRVAKEAISVGGTSRSSTTGKNVEWYLLNKKVPSRTDNPNLYRQWRHANESNKPGRRRFAK